MRRLGPIGLFLADAVPCDRRHIAPVCGGPGTIMSEQPVVSAEANQEPNEAEHVAVQPRLSQLNQLPRLSWQ